MNETINNAETGEEPTAASRKQTTMAYHQQDTWHTISLISSKDSNIDFLQLKRHRNPLAPYASNMKLDWANAPFEEVVKWMDHCNISLVPNKFVPVDSRVRCYHVVASGQQQVLIGLRWNPVSADMLYQAE